MATATNLQRLGSTLVPQMWSGGKKDAAEKIVAITKTHQERKATAKVSDFRSSFSFLGQLAQP